MIGAGVSELKLSGRHVTKVAAILQTLYKLTLLKDKVHQGTRTESHLQTPTLVNVCVTDCVIHMEVF